jgi:hypothetical protein
VTEENKVIEPVGETPKIETPTVTSQEPPKVEPPKAEPPKVDTFIENLNKDFGTTYKSRDELKEVFGLPKKITEYETKIKESENLAKSIEDYKKKIEELEKLEDPAEVVKKYFSTPDAYVAEQLRIKYPNSNPSLLYEIATSNVDEMSDFDVLVKAKKLFVPKVAKGGYDVEGSVMRKYALEAGSKPEDWDINAKTDMAIDVAVERDRFSELKRQIKLPEFPSKEQRAKEEADALAKREQALTPLKEQFAKYDTFKHTGIENFIMDVPTEYKTKLPEIFDGFFGAGLEPDQENMQSAQELRDALFVLEYLPKLREIWIKEGDTIATKRFDELSHNIQPPNTTTATDQGTGEPKQPGLDQYSKDQSRRVASL